MRIAVSNIAWPPECEMEARAMLRSHGVGAIEVAPTRLWPGWDGCTVAAAQDAAAGLAAEGLECTSLQAVLFGRPDLQMFGSPPARAALSAHLRHIAAIAAGLGARAVVLGAPGNRRRGDLAEPEAFTQAADLLAAVANSFHAAGVALCLEANPAIYGCDFITDTDQAARLVRTVASPGLRLHMDTGGMALSGEDPARLIEENADILAHFHASQPHLAGFDAPWPGHIAAAAALRRIGWPGVVAIEMRAAPDPLPALDQALRRVIDIYGPD